MTGGEIGAENVINILKPEGTVHVLCCLTAKKNKTKQQNRKPAQQTHWSKHFGQVLSSTQTFVSLLFPHFIGVYGIYINLN